MCLSEVHYKQLFALEVFTSTDGGCYHEGIAHRCSEIVTNAVTLLD